MSDDDPSKRAFGDGAHVLHRHQAVYVAGVASDVFPWVRCDYLVTHLDAHVPPGRDGPPGRNGDGVRFVHLPLGDDSAAVVVPGEVVTRLLATSVIQPYVHREVPEWGY